MAYCVRVHKAGGDVQGIVQIEYAQNTNKNAEQNKDNNTLRVNKPN